MHRVRYLLVATMTFAACDACGPGADPLDAGLPDDGFGFDAGPPDAGFQTDAGTEGEDAGSAAVDAGPYDAGFDWTDVVGDGGLPPELACLPGTTPEASLSGLLAALELSTYSGRAEDGVVCGGTTCAPGVPCCVFCGYAKCAEPDDAGVLSCPALTQELVCDGEEDCPGSDDADTCCYSLAGSDCRARAECTFELPDLGGLLDGGFALPELDGGADEEDAGGDADAGDADAGDEDAGDEDAGDADAGADQDAGGPADAGAVDDDAGAADAGPAIDLAAILDQGLPVCTTSIPFLTECDVFNGELCCTSERFVAIDIGLCVPALVCLGGQLP